MKESIELMKYYEGFNPAYPTLQFLSQMLVFLLILALNKLTQVMTPTLT